jgi:hypothetical protein
MKESKKPRRGETEFGAQLTSYPVGTGGSLVSRDSSVGIATTLRAGRSGDQIPVGARFSAPVLTGPEAYPASCTMGTGSFPVVKRPGRGVEHPPSSSAEVKERIQLYLYSPSGPSWPVIELTLPLPFTFYRRFSPLALSCSERGG